MVDWETMAIFGAYNMVFGKNMVILKYSVIKKIQQGGGQRGGIKSGVRTPVLTLHLKKAGKGYLGQIKWCFG